MQMEPKLDRSDISARSARLCGDIIAAGVAERISTVTDSRKEQKLILAQVILGLELALNAPDQL